MANFVKPIREEGIVISKIHTEAKPARTSFDGKTTYPAVEEKFEIEVISCDKDDFSKENGMPNASRVKYPVDKATFDKVKFGDWASVKYTAQQYGDKLNTIPQTFELIKETNK